MKHLIKLSMVSLAVVSVYYVASFLWMVAHPVVSVLSGASLVFTYVGLAYTPFNGKQKDFAIYVAAFAMGIEVAYGVTWNMSQLSPEMFVLSSMPIWMSITLSLLHGAPFSILLFLTSLLVFKNEEAKECTLPPVPVQNNGYNTFHVNNGHVVNGHSTAPVANGHNSNLHVEKKETKKGQQACFLN